MIKYARQMNLGFAEQWYAVEVVENKKYLLIFREKEYLNNTTTEEKLTFVESGPHKETIKTLAP